ncbi:hypothetical protein EDB89DRAFT_2249750 [Lactarius sanguifluus]|nr:hypothetical protein EDB89DRAFT_2249750 [Lactarius sanguifluus]
MGKYEARHGREDFTWAPKDYKLSGLRVREGRNTGIQAIQGVLRQLAPLDIRGASPGSLPARPDRGLIDGPEASQHTTGPPIVHHPSDGRLAIGHTSTVDYSLCFRPPQSVGPRGNTFMIDSRPLPGPSTQIWNDQLLVPRHTYDFAFKSIAQFFTPTRNSGRKGYRTRTGGSANDSGGLAGDTLAAVPIPATVDATPMPMEAMPAPTDMAPAVAPMPVTLAATHALMWKHSQGIVNQEEYVADLREKSTGMRWRHRTHDWVM